MARDDIEPRTDLDRTAEAIESAKERSTLVLEVSGTLPLDEDRAQAGMERIRKAKDTRHVRLVVVQRRQQSGQGGTVLLLLADARVLLQEGASISALSEGVLESAESVGVCARRNKPRDTSRTDLCELLKGSNGRPIPGKEIYDPQPAPRTAPGGPTVLRFFPPLGDRPSTSLPTTEEDSGGGGIGLPEVLLTTLLAAVVALFALAVLRTRHRRPSVAGPGLGAMRAPTDRPVRSSRPPLPERPPNPTRPADRAASHREVRRAVPDGPVRPATVRTLLRPQGYVELDGWLRRAIWAEPYLAAADAGAAVDVTDHHTGVLRAYAPGGPRT
ncbi:hypothetical protein [Streptomyces sp. NPDC059063]|uniref:hypothetical protein n=1 Tax=unclassified Streptomyces TaxID=2593676 RepID=UPI0036CD1A14